MRKCDNCIYGSYGLDCNNGTETLYCGIYDYEYEVIPNDVCDEHQYIEGLSNEKNYVLYDEKYLGPGYFIINEVDNDIVKFIKLYTINNDGFPHYCLRAFSVDAKDNTDKEFTTMEFTFRSMEDFDNGLYNVFMELAKNINGNITTIDEYYEGKNNISFLLGDKGIIRMIVSKDIWRGKQHPTDFIDINIGDNYSCINYEAINKFYNMLSEISYNNTKTNDINRILKLKL